MVKTTQYTKKNFVKQSSGKTLKYGSGYLEKLFGPKAGKNGRGRERIQLKEKEELEFIFPKKLNNDIDENYLPVLLRYVFLKTEELKKFDEKYNEQTSTNTTEENTPRGQGGHVGATKIYNGMLLKKIDDKHREFQFYYILYLLQAFEKIDTKIIGKIANMAFKINKNNNVMEDNTKSCLLQKHNNGQTGGDDTKNLYKLVKPSDFFKELVSTTIQQEPKPEPELEPEPEPKQEPKQEPESEPKQEPEPEREQDQQFNIKEYVLVKIDSLGADEWFVMENLGNGINDVDILDFKIGFKTISSLEDVIAEKEQKISAVKKKFTQKTFVDDPSTSSRFGFRMEGGKIKLLFNEKNSDKIYSINILESLFEDKKEEIKKILKYQIKKQKKKLIPKTTEIFIKEGEKKQKLYMKNNHPFNNFSLIQKNFEKQYEKQSIELFKNLLISLEKLMEDLFIPNYEAINDDKKIAFGCVGSSIMIAYGIDSENNKNIKVNAKLADFGHGYLYSKKIHNVKIDKGEMKTNLGYVKNMTIGAYQLYIMFFLYCEAMGIINNDSYRYEKRNLIRSKLTTLINEYINMDKKIFI